MELNNIKKALYKQNPRARFQFIRSGIAYYIAPITDGTIDQETKIEVTFEVPVVDMGIAEFHDVMDAKHLIRWISGSRTLNF
jgi:hypothetical protein